NSSDPKDRALFKLLKSHCARYDYATAGIDGLLRSSDKALEQHLNSWWWPDWLTPLRRYVLCAHRRCAETLYVGPRRTSGSRPPGMFLCYRIPIGADPTLAQYQLDCLNHQLHDGLLYSEREGDCHY